MNALYGYPTAGPVALARLGALAANTPDAASEASIWAFINGDYLQELKDVHAEINSQFAETDALYNSIQAMPAGAQKNAALAAQQAAVKSITQQFVAYRQARDKYNDIATQISGNSGGLYTPSLMSGLGQLETVMTVAVIAAIAFAISQLASLIGAVRGQSNASRGYIDQAAGLVHEMGGTIEKVGVTAVKVGSTLVWVAVAGVALYFGFKWFKSRRAGGTAAAAPVGPELAAGAGI